MAARTSRRSSLVSQTDSEPSSFDFPPDDAFAPDARGNGFDLFDKAASVSVLDHLPAAQPFPIDSLPHPLQQFLTEQSRSLNCDPTAIALPMLSVLASALGGNKRIQLKQGASEPAILWTAVVRDDLAPHDSILEAVLAPLRTRQAAAFQQRQSQMLSYRHRLAAFRTNQRGYPDGTYPPVEPLAERTLTVDWTLPALSRLLTKQSRGLLVCPLELDDWLRRSTGSGVRAAIDRQAWFDLHAGRSVIIENRTPLHLSSAAVSLTGTISDQVLSRRLTNQSTACGITGRLLFAAPPAFPPCWPDVEVDPATIQGYASLVEKLFSLSTPTKPSPNAVSSQGAPEFAIPLNGVPSDVSPVTLSPEAHNVYSEFVTDLGARLELIDKPLFAWISHLPGQAARLALIIHESRWAAGEAVDPNVCDQNSVRSAVVLTRWFIAEAHRLLQKQSLIDEQDDLQQLYDWLQQRQTPVSPRDLCRSNGRKYPTIELATAALNKLANLGLTGWSTTTSGPQGGRPTRKAELIPPPAEGDHPPIAASSQLCRTTSPHNPPDSSPAVNEWPVAQSSPSTIDRDPAPSLQSQSPAASPEVVSDNPSAEQSFDPQSQKQTSPKNRVGNRTNPKHNPSKTSP